MAARAGYSSVATVFASNGSPGTFGAHYSFPMWTKCANGDLYVVVRKASTHASSDGVLVGKRCLSGADPGTSGNWSSEDVLSVNSASLDDRPGGTLKTLASGRNVMVWQRWNNVLTSPSRQHTAWFAYSDDHCATWSTPVEITTGHYATIACPSDLIEMLNGDLLCATYGCPTNDINGQWDVRLSKSTNGGASWTDFGEVVDGTTITGQVLSEPSLALLDTGGLFLTFQDVGVGTQPVYKMFSTSPHDGTAWGSPTSFISSAPNRHATVQTSDRDILVCGYGGYATSLNRGVSFGAAVSVGSANNWVSPNVLDSAGVDPNVGLAWANESGGQDSASTYFRTYTATADGPAAIVAAGYGNTISEGYGSAEATTPAALTIDPASTAWEQVGTSITVRTTSDDEFAPTPATVTATVNSPAGGLLRFRGTDAARFAASLDGTTWASTVDIPAGENTIYLRVTPTAAGTTMSAEIGVPI